MKNRARTLALILGTGLFTALAVFLFGVRTRVETHRIASLGTETVDSLWFSPAGDVVTLARRGEEASVKIWKNESGTLNQTHRIDFAKLAAQQKPQSRPAGKESSGARGAPSPDEKEKAYLMALQTQQLRQQKLPIAQQALRGERLPPESYREEAGSIQAFAVSRAGNQVAWAANGVLHLRPLPLEGEVPSQFVRLRPAIPVSALAFTESGLLAVLFRDGTLEVRNQKLKQVDSARLWEDEGARQARESSTLMPPVLWAFGPYLVAASLPDRQAIVIQPGSSSPLLPWRFNWESAYLFALAVSATGQVALGMDDGSVLLRGFPGPAQTDRLLEAPGVATALAFHDDGRLIVGGDFRGIYLLSEETSPQEVIREAVGTRLLAAGRDRWAYADSGGAALVAPASRSVISSAGYALVGAWLLLGIGVLAHLQWSTYGQRRAVTRRRIAEDAFFEPRVLPRAAALEEERQLEPIPPPDPPESLVEAIARGDCVLYAGAGLAAQAGLPTWTPFLKRLASYGRERGLLDERTAEAVYRALASGEYSVAADELLAVVPRESIREYIGSLLRQAVTTETFKILGQLPFAGVVNTNFDTLLPTAFKQSQRPIFLSSDTELLLQSLRKSQFFALNVNGRLDDPNSLVLTSQEYRDAMARNLAFKQFMQTLFVRKTFFFLGVSLEGIRDYLGALDLSTLRMEREHFALVGDRRELDEAQVRFLRRNYNIHVLAYRPRPGYPEVKEFLEKLQDGVRRTGPVESPAGRPALNRVALTNIGPFAALDIELTPTWNVVLGDNGMGKSVLLRSIAAALCGENADPASVTRLLRSGSSAGRIDLYVGRDRYTVELQRDAEGEVRIKSASLSPLQLGNWLVLGFPALRSITWDRPRGPGKEHRSHPSPSDLLPILTGRPDMRLNDLKQWLINIHYKASGEGPEVENARRLFYRFFEVLDEITPDTTLKFHSIDKDTHEIRLETDGGVVPLEAVSQGTVSVIGWVGALLQRMHEVYSSHPSPEEERALVLVDEIDAHMHPSWQRSLASQLKKLFPELQVLATTHSPLIVSALQPEEILVVQRDPANRQVQMEKPGLNVQGWRADQILTGPLFRLASTRDPETQRRLMRYTELAALEEPTEAEREELQQHAEFLKIRLLGPEEREEARKAFEMIKGAIQERVDAIPAEERKKMLEEVRVQLQETFSSSQRPR